MVATLEATDLDGRLVASFDEFFSSLQTTDVDTFAHKWKNIQNDLVGNKDTGTETTSLALGVSQYMELLCDAFITLEVETEGAAAKIGELLASEPPEEEESSSTSTSRSPSPSPASTPLAPYITEAYSWLLSNLHNPYPPASLKDQWAASTNSERRLIDAWFIDVRRRIGWTNLLSSSKPPADDVRRKHRDVGPGTNELKYSSRKDLVAAATEFFIYSRGLATPPAKETRTSLLLEAEMRFRLLENEAQLLYRNHHNPNLHKFAGPSALALEVVGQVKQWTPELGEEAKKFREQEKKNKRKRRNMEDEDEDEDIKRLRLDASPSPSPTTSTFSSFDSPSPSLSNLKRKRASSETHDPEPVSPSTKRLRTALNSSSFRSVSDPTPIPIPTHPEEQEPVTFDGFPSSMLDTWFYQTQTQGNEFGFVDPFESSDPLDPFYRYGLGALDPVVRSEDTTVACASPSSTSNAGPIPPPIQPYPLSIDLADLSVFSRSASTSSRSPSYDDEGLSSPGTPALSASGSLTDASETEDEADGDVDTDSLFGDADGDSVSIANPEVELESGVGKVQQVEAKSPLAPASLSPTGTNSVIPNFTSSFDPSASAPFDPTTSFEFDSIFDGTTFPLDDFNFDLGMESFPNFEVGVGGLGLMGAGAGGVWPGPTPTRETFAASASS